MIGINAILLPASYMEKNSMLAAHSVLQRDARVPSGELWAGNPAAFKRKLTDDEIHAFQSHAEAYSEVAEEHASEFLPHGTHYQDAERRGITVGFTTSPFV